MKITNLTPHEVTVLDASNNIISRFPSAGIARAAQYREKIGEIDGIPVSRTSYGEVENLPEQEAGTVYIVSILTAQAAPYRKDLYIVDDTVRDDAGRIIGCRALAQI